MFHGKRDSKGYYSADFFCETFPAIASDRGKRGIKGYENTVVSYPFITLYNPFNLGFYEITSM